MAGLPSLNVFIISFILFSNSSSALVLLSSSLISIVSRSLKDFFKFSILFVKASTVGLLFGIFLSTTSVMNETIDLLLDNILSLLRFDIPPATFNIDWITATFPFTISASIDNSDATS